MSKLNVKNLTKVTEILLAEYPDAECALIHKNVYELLVATVLSAQTTDVSVNKVTPALFKKAGTALKMSKMQPEEVEEYIHSIGMYKQKARNVVNLSKQLVERFEGAVPQDFDALVSLPGVGRKTANVVLSVGFGEQHIAVDTHVFRLANRIGLVEENNVLDTELSLMKKIPEEHWTEMHHALIFHGRKICHAKNPLCEKCCIKNVCKKNLL